MRTGTPTYSIIVSAPALPSVASAVSWSIQVSAEPAGARWMRRVAPVLRRARVMTSAELAAGLGQVPRGRRVQARSASGGDWVRTDASMPGRTPPAPAPGARQGE